MESCGCGAPGIVEIMRDGGMSPACARCALKRSLREATEKIQRADIPPCQQCGAQQPTQLVQMGFFYALVCPGCASSVERMRAADSADVDRFHFVKRGVEALERIAAANEAQIAFNERMAERAAPIATAARKTTTLKP